MAGLLVSVRSAVEARSALDGGASVIDIKEPDRGPLGRADLAVWDDVRRALPRHVPVSVALGELNEWDGTDGLSPDQFWGLSYRKLGLAGAGADWAESWARLRRGSGEGPGWVAVAYADWARADAPSPDDVLDVALASADCVGVLVDTWDKCRPNLLDLSWSPWIRRAQKGGRIVALAGGLDKRDLIRLAPLRPDLFAVRGAACRRGDRRDVIDPDRVARLVRAAQPLVPMTREI